MAINQIANLGVKVDPRGAVTGANRAKRAITGIGNSARNVKNRIMSMQGALLGLGAGALVKSIITTASEVESLQVRLKFLTGSAEDSAKAFETMTKFASQVPFSLQDIERASPLLLTVADDVDQLNELLSITGDIAAVSGLSFEATAGQLQRALSGGIASADLFRERGVKAFLGFEEGVQYSAQETSKHIFKLFRDGTTTAKGATEELKNTFQGQVSMMQDAFRELKLAIADAGVFELTKDAVIRITEELKKPETVKAMQDIGKALTTMGRESGEIINKFMALPPEVKSVGLIMALLGGTKGRLAIVGIIAFKDELKEIFELLDSGLAQVGKTPTTLGGLETALEKARFEAEIYRSILKRIQELQTGTILEKGLAFFTTSEKSAKKDVEKAEALVNELEASIQKLKRSISLEGLDFKPFTKQALDDLTDFSQLYLDAMKPITDINEFLSGRLDMGETLDMTERKGLPEHLLMVSEMTDKVTNSFYRLKPATEIMGEKFDEMARKTAEANEKVKEFSDGLADNIEDSIMRMTQGLMSFKDVVKNVFQYVAMQMVRNNIAKPLASSLSSIITGAVGGFATGTSGSPSSIFPPRANGGNVNAGQPYMVGERGAELFVPQKSGTIVPNNQLGGGQNINVTYAPQVNALDPRTAQTVIAENAPTIVGLVRQAFERNGQQVAL